MRHFSVASGLALEVVFGRDGFGGREHLGDAPARDLDVLRIEVVAHVAPPERGRGDERRTAAHERIENKVVLERVQPDQLLRKLDGERGRMTDPARALGGHVPHVEGEGHEVFGHQCALEGKAGRLALLRRLRTVEAAFAGDHDALGDVAQHRIRGAAERSPRTRRRRALALLPDELAA